MRAIKLPETTAGDRQFKRQCLTKLTKQVLNTPVEEMLNVDLQQMAEEDDDREILLFAPEKIRKQNIMLRGRRQSSIREIYILEPEEKETQKL